MDTLTDIFGLFCGQRSCLLAGGEMLPVCPRCLGLYVGAAVTAGWLAGSGIWRRGLPSWGVFLVNEVVLLAAMLGGLHAWGPSPAWKVACGLWTGHVVLLWLVGGAGHLWRLARRPRPAQLPWRTCDKLQALAAPPLLAGLGWLAPHAMAIGWLAWSAAMALGALALAAAVVAAGVALAAYVVAGLRGSGTAVARTPRAD
jgi:hypothetical protein